MVQTAAWNQTVNASLSNEAESQNPDNQKVYVGFLVLFNL